MYKNKETNSPIDYRSIIDRLRHVGARITLINTWNNIYSRYDDLEGSRRLSRIAGSQKSRRRIARAIGGGEITSYDIALARGALQRPLARSLENSRAPPPPPCLWEADTRGRDKERAARGTLTSFLLLFFSPPFRRSPLSTISLST